MNIIKKNILLLFFAYFAYSKVTEINLGINGMKYAINKDNIDD